MYTKSFFLLLLILAQNASALQEKSEPSKEAQKGAKEKDTTTRSSSNGQFPVEHTSADGKFSICFPGKPLNLKQSYATPVGTIDAKITVYNGKNDSFAIVVSDYPDGHMRANGLDKVLASAKEGTAKEVTGSVTAEEPYAVGKYKGQQFIVADEGNGKQLHVRQLIVGDRLYQILVGNSADNSDDELVMPFMNTFKLL